MDRILDLQKIDTAVGTDTGAAASTSSWIGCDCSTHSNTGCIPPVEKLLLV